MGKLRVSEAQSNWILLPGDKLSRPSGLPAYIVAQYMSELDLSVAGVKQPVKRGAVAIIAPNVPHAYYCTGKLLHHWLHIEGDMSSLLQAYNLSDRCIYNVDNREEISGIFRQISRAYHDQSPFREEYMLLKTKELLLALAMHRNLYERLHDISYTLALRLRELRIRMLEHPELDWSVATMAKQVFMSESYFFSLYRKCFGISPNKDLIAIRIDMACTRLRQGSSVTTTAEQCGYTSVYHFIRQFKKITGTTPYQYWQQQNRPDAAGQKE